MEKGKVRGIPYFKCGPPRGPLVNRPSIEYSGFGDTLCFECWGGRYFRSDPEAVEEQIEMFIRKYRDDKETVNFNDLYGLLNIEQTTMGGTYGYSPSPDWYQELGFITEFAAHDSKIVCEMGEPVFLIEPDYNSQPFESYWEV